MHHHNFKKTPLGFAYTYKISIIKERKEQDVPKKPQQLENEILKAGFILQKGKGKGGHRRYRHPDGRTTEIPFHSKEIKKGTEQAIKKGLTCPSARLLLQLPSASRILA
ncbi:type II toxin-antitoxin system HicA family toxin [Pediococcus acidilactici]